MSFRAGFIAALTLIAFASSATAAIVHNNLTATISFRLETPDRFIGDDGVALFQGDGRLSGSAFRLFSGVVNEPLKPINRITDATGRIIGTDGLDILVVSPVSRARIPPELPYFMAALGVLLTVMVFRKTSWDMVQH